MIIGVSTLYEEVHEVNVKKPMRLLAVFAHPDDESFGPGGTLALYAKQGVEVQLICATRGEAGRIPQSLANVEESVAQLREAELRCAAHHLGLSGVHFLEYRDSGMPGSPDNRHPRALISAPMDEVAGRITHLMRQLKPQVVITFDPKGGYLHPDHIAIHHATVEAFHAAGNPSRYRDQWSPHQPQKLYFVAFPIKFLRFANRILQLIGKDPHHFGQNRDIDLVEITREEYPIHARINIRSVMAIKERAASCHASQLEGGFKGHGFMGWFLRPFMRYEFFTRAHPLAPADLHENDLFQDVTP
jgi:LmbE family N-acetylglucosaminyl deacetylase